MGEKIYEIRTEKVVVMKSERVADSKYTSGALVFHIQFTK